ncbi:hypothetical protein BZA70DRAFT_312217 [Myxozyma melibiosi]|uniref:VPS9 domain-containing protein n=1 Tax=Myxozyma melibiosi TaxID=54550 RepID=A0ABR1F144_9ASCO
MSSAPEMETPAPALNEVEGDIHADKESEDAAPAAAAVADEQEEQVVASSKEEAAESSELAEITPAPIPIVPAAKKSLLDSDQAEMVPLAASSSSSSSTPPNPVPTSQTPPLAAPQPIVGTGISSNTNGSAALLKRGGELVNNMGPALQSILEQFDPLSLVANANHPDNRPPVSRSSSGGSSASRLSRSSSAASLMSRFQKSATGAAGDGAGKSHTALPPRTSSRKGSASSSSTNLKSSEQTSEPAPASSSQTQSTTEAQDDKQGQSLPKPEDQPVELPFDFQRFLNQLRVKGADPLSRYLKSFLHEFGKRSWTVREQVKIVQDFQNFIAPRIPLYPPFNNLPETEVANALEGMEKLIMNRLYSQTFSPEIPRARRTFSHEEDLLRDRVLEEKMGIWSWIEPEHLDVEKSIIDSGERFILLAQDELLKITNYRAPRDKVICILNCCKVIFGLLRQTKTEESADKFLPILIYVVIKAQPKHLTSNVQYIMRFRNPDKLNGEAGYYLSSLQGAISFIESLDRSALNITDEEFDERVTQSVARIQEKESKAGESVPNPPRLRSSVSSGSSTAPTTTTTTTSSSGDLPTPAAATQLQSTSTPPLSSRPESPPSRPFSPADVAGVASDVASQVHEALSATFTAPFKQFSKLFDTDEETTAGGQQQPTMMRRTRTVLANARRSSVPPAPRATSVSGSVPARTETASATTTTHNNTDLSSHRRSMMASVPHSKSTTTTHQRTFSTASTMLDPSDVAARQESIENAEARRIELESHAQTLETLHQMFPNLDKDVIEDVVSQKHGRIGAAIDACLSLQDD